MTWHPYHSGVREEDGLAGRRLVAGRYRAIRARGPELGSGARAGMRKGYRGGFGGSWWLDGGEGEREGCQQGGGMVPFTDLGDTGRGVGLGLGGGGDKQLSSLTTN